MIRAEARLDLAKIDRTKFRAALASSLETKTGRLFRVTATDHGLAFEIGGETRTVPWERGQDTVVGLFQRWFVAGRPDSTAWLDATEIGQQNSSYVLAVFKHVASQCSIDAGQPTPLMDYSPAKTFKLGDRLKHPTFGEGLVTGANVRQVDVAFTSGERRKLAHVGERPTR